MGTQQHGIIRIWMRQKYEMPTGHLNLWLWNSKLSENSGGKDGNISLPNLSKKLHKQKGNVHWVQKYPSRFGVSLLVFRTSATAGDYLLLIMSERCDKEIPLHGYSATQSSNEYLH